MFSFGIFTTHIPYIAIVAFYAYFLIFGVEKASKGKVTSESYFKIEIETENYLNHSTCQSAYYYQYECNFIKTALYENHVLKRKLKHSDFIYSQPFWQDIYESSLFSRPPPFLS